MISQVKNARHFSRYAASPLHPVIFGLFSGQIGFQAFQVGFQFRQDAVSPGRPHQVVQLLGVIDDVKKPGIAAFLEFNIFVWKFSVLD